MTRFQVEGTTQDIQTCDHCGRTELQKTVIVGWLDVDGNKTGQNHFGTTCVGYATRESAPGYDWKKSIKRAEKEQRAARRESLGKAISALTHPVHTPGEVAYLDGFRGRDIRIAVAKWIDDIEVLRVEFREGKRGVQTMRAHYTGDQVEQAIANGQAYLS